MYKIYMLLLAALILLSGCAKTENQNKDENNSVQSIEETVSLENEDKTSSSIEDVESMENTDANSLNNEDDYAQIVFEGHDIEGNTVSSTIFSESKLTMVNVWATYCNPCLSEMPGLGELAAEYDSEEFQIIGIVSDVQEGASQEMMDLAEDLIEQTGADYTHLLLNEELYYALLTDVSAVPTTFFINENGVILDGVIGAMDKSAWEEKINALLEE
ncbi:MAG: TlpA family protein disulfide reductase [Lachnospiraceae bacterium]|nr:TlpA family protein disulfide reductase [Lachnospiraceae bacterium]